ncbi:octopamine receptor Oamb-like [Mercenaria mercenaria]|uniref:octopamine receptor Oamb-like n=1 Tax=Mercenaria mercenaria TaxID=6596 RepID=UPI00234EB1A0|nr:octopamine receptor Oamb-like [Mercenaria mercenaria]XP_053379849.1 octopamine receptor Oamb-like [Mercenaria mercenaria]XP_053379850.1 octopamine receptor Oamb-like [Mercenaria mercenaria]XP_053379851.1 octopamine receptor Oamb-like [Mercenaria mercenaria]
MMEDPDTIVVMVLLSIFSICGTIGNSLVLYIYSHKKEKSTAGIFIMSLAGTDLFTCLFLMPFSEAVVYLEYRLQYDVACKIYMFFITCNIPFAAFIMVAIATDRYFCICHPFLHVLNIKRAKIIVLCLLAAASSFGIVTSLMHGVYRYQDPNVPPTNNLSNIEKTNFQITNTFGGLGGNISSVLQNGEFKNDTSENRTNSIVQLCAQNLTCVNASTSSADNMMEANMDLDGVCMPNSIIIGTKYVDLYQKMYAGTYLLSFFAVVVLYGLIYKSIHEHRAKRSKRKRSSLYPAGVEFSTVETQFTAVTHVNPHKRGSSENGTSDQAPEVQPMRPKARQNSKALSIKEKTLIANIRTAVMLFVVTIVFLVAFLPAWLMSLQLMDYNQIVFYMYFMYHTANPFIYAFMNKSFRDDLGKVLKCQSMPMVR